MLAEASTAPPLSTTVSSVGPAVLTWRSSARRVRSVSRRSLSTSAAARRTWLRTSSVRLSRKGTWSRPGIRTGVRISWVIL